MARYLTDDDMDLASRPPEAQSTPVAATPADVAGAATHAAPAATSPAPPTPATPTRFLSDADMDAASPHGYMPSGEAAARLFYKHLTFGTQPFADRAKAEQAAAEHPILDIGTGAGAMLAQTAALGPIAAYAKGVQGAGMLANAARGAGSAIQYTMLPNLGARTALTAARTGAKLAGNYSALEALGTGATDPNKTLSDVAKDIGKAYAIGTGEGAVLGMGAHGVSRLAGKVATNMFPALKDVREAAAHPDAMGARDVANAAGENDFTLQDFQNLRNRVADPANATQYKDLNLMEAMQSGDLVQTGPTGELKPQIHTMPDVAAIAQDAANMQSAGQHKATQAFASRKNQMAGAIQEDINRLFPMTPAEATARATGNPIPVPNNTQLVPDLVDTSFGTGNKLADDAATEAQKAAFRRRYGRIGGTELKGIEDLGKAAQTVPELNKAINYAAQRDMTRLVTEGGANAEWRQPWSARDLGSTIKTLSADNILDIHHSLVMQSKVPFGSPVTPEMMSAKDMKTFFSAWADRALRGHEKLRQDYAMFKRAMEATEQGANTPLQTGGSDHIGVQFLQKALDDRGQAVTKVQNLLNRYTRNYGDAANPITSSGDARLTKSTANTLRVAEQRLDQHQSIVDAWRKAWAQRNFTDPIAAGQDANKIVHNALTPEGMRRIRMSLPPNDAEAFINHLYNIEARNQGASLGLNSGDADNTARLFHDKMTNEGRDEALTHFAAGWGDRIQRELNARTDGAGVNNVVDRLLTPEGKARILRYLGNDNGTEFIKALYNKDLQGQLSQRLWGNSNTAYKLARQNKGAAGASAIYNLMPWHFHPLEAARALRELGSAAYMERRGSQINSLLSGQGRDEILGAIDAILANEQRRNLAHPIVRNPFLRWSGPLGTTTPGIAGMSPYDQNQGQAGQGRSSGGWVWRPYDGQQPKP